MEVNQPQNREKTPSTAKQKEWVHLGLRLILVALAYFAAAQLGLLFVLQPEKLAGIWPASGIALAAVLFSTRSRQPRVERWAVLAIIFVVNLFSNLVTGSTLPVSLGFAIANTLEPAIGAFVFLLLINLNQASSPKTVEHITFENLQEVLALIAAAAAATIASAFLGALVPWLGHNAAYWEVWKVWWAEDSLGIVLFTPAILSFLVSEPTLQARSTRRKIELALLTTGIGVISWFSFGLGEVNAFSAVKPYLLFLFVFWVAMRFPLRVVSLELMLLAGVALGCTVANLGTYPLGGITPGERLISVQVYLFIASLTGLILSAIFSENSKAENALRSNEKRFRALIEHSADAFALLRADGTIAYEGPSAERLTGYKPEELVVKDSLAFIYPADLPEVKFAFARLAGQPGGMETLEFRVIRKDGTICWLETTATNMVHRPEVQAIVLNYRDITERKQAEEKLQTSEQTLKLFVEYAPAAIAMFDREMRYLAASRRYLIDYRLRQQNILGRSHYEIFPEIPQRWKDIHQRCQAGNVESAEEDPFPRADGTLDWIRWEIHPWYEQTGQIGGILLFSEIITERKNAKEQISRLAERLDLAAQSAHLGVWDWDIINDRLVWDDQMYALYGMQLGTFGGAYDAWLDGVHPDDRAYSAEAIRLALSGEKEYDIEFRVIWPDGTVHWMKAHGQVILDENDHPCRMTGINYDVTERKQADDLLRQRNAFIETILENAPIGFAVNSIDDGQATFVSSKFDTIYGLQPGTLTSVDDYFEKVYLDPILREQMRERMLSDMASGDAARMRWENIPLTTGSGEQRVVTAINIPVLEQNLMISTVQDVTERWHAEEVNRQLSAELEQRVIERTAQLEAANRELEAFSYSVSHDLRAPLRGIDGWSLALYEDYYQQLDEQGRQYIERVRGETQRMGQLIDDLLRLSRLSRAEMQRSAVDLSEMAQTIAGRLMETQPDRSVEWVIQPGLIAYGDLHLLEIVMTNLLSNAFKFSGTQPQARIEFGQAQINGQSTFFIRDNGVGFNMTYAKNLFGAFQRMHRQSDFPGTGIGLATAQRIIHRHGGSIWAEAEKNVGATFYFTLAEAA